MNKGSNLPPIIPPLLNSANPWATTYEDIHKLYTCTHTGAITTRTCTRDGFPHDPTIHQYAFFNPATNRSSAPNPPENLPEHKDMTGSLNTLGYSPLPLAATLANIQRLWDGIRAAQRMISADIRTNKPILVSVTGSPDEIRECHMLISTLATLIGITLWMEINLSCPNIKGKPPPAYSYDGLVEYLLACKEARELMAADLDVDEDYVPIGIKTPPYTNPSDIMTLQRALLAVAGETGRAPIEFITAVNTLGSSLLLQPSNTILPVLNSANETGIGGMAGTPLHPLALGNVRMLRSMLDERDELRHIQVIGIGGVFDNAGFERMKSVGAFAVGVGTALGRKGVGIFEEILGRSKDVTQDT